VPSTTRTTWARQICPPSTTATSSFPVRRRYFRFIGRWRSVVIGRLAISALVSRRRRPTGTWGVPVSIASVTVPVTTCVLRVPVGRRRGTGGATCVLAIPVVSRGTGGRAGSAGIIERVPGVVQHNDALVATTCVGAVPVGRTSGTGGATCRILLTK